MQMPGTILIKKCELACLFKSAEPSTIADIHYLFPIPVPKRALLRIGPDVRTLHLEPTGVPKTRTARGSRAIHGLDRLRSEEHTSELQSLMRISYAVFCLKKKTTISRLKQNNY